MGYRGKLEEQDKARRLRAEGRTLADIASILSVSKSSVSLWVRDIPIEIVRRAPVRHRPHPQHEAKLAQIATCDEQGIIRLSALSDPAFLAAGAALYAGEGSKGDGKVLFANTDPGMVRFFCLWLRRFFTIDESRLRARVYLHEGLSIEDAEQFWSDLICIPLTQFRAPYRATPDPSIRRTKHVHGCMYVYYCCSRTHREIMGLVRALLSSNAIPG